ncbi:MAG TPA: ribosome maturation factor RimP [Sulfuriferula sp.]|uniref:Ribosome maturation factor RimP n=1 Tax=Sulfuriferula multivorans TaxID=1559896 RepID=A0A401JG83_9PROT|nr:ribosome maturation factor RimP [Sulfuriferula multivorans]GBL46637.1 clustered with transcription termination protein NusA [Sulfuriferula multivorans]HUW29819.1 ribosome maturation factor RimP [Sulfuriferula sp.]
MTLETLLETTLNGLGYELVDMSMSAKSGLLRVFIDKQGGITLDDCTAVSNHLSNLLVVENIAYEHLEVSSPGLDRPLKKLDDFRRFAGEKVQIKLRMAIAGQRRFAGIIRGASATQIELDVDGQAVMLDFSNMDTARLVPDL